MAEQAIFTTHQGETVTAFALGKLKEEYYPGAITRGTDNVDYKFINGFVDVGELPCRTAIRADISQRSVELTPFKAEALNLPGFNRRLEFSGFWHRPTRLTRWAKTTLIPPSAGRHKFRLETCGGVHLWVDGQLLMAFEPYSRNEPRKIEVDLPLKTDGSEVVLLIEEMAERDTNYFVELTWLCEGELKAVLNSSADAGALIELMDVARDIHPDKLCFSRNDDLVLRCANVVTRDIEVEALVKPSVHMRHTPPLFESKATLKNGTQVVNLGGLSELGDEYHPLQVTLSIGESRITRQIDFALLNEQKPAKLPASLSDRKALALRYAAANGEARIGKVLAQLACGDPLDASALAIIDDTLATIKGRKDCSDFVLIPLLWIFADYCETLPEDVADEIRKTILGYRYWMNEPGNDTMWFWSENHVLCFLVSGLIAGELFPDDVFPNSGIKGTKQSELAASRLDRWFQSVEADGLAEWNSAAYYPVDFIGLLALQHLGNAPLKSRTVGLLDSLFKMIALHVNNGVCAGTMGRAYDKELRSGPLTELSPFAAVAFGHGWLNQGVASLPMFCASDYEPPTAYGSLANPPHREVLTAHYVQGYGVAAQLALSKTASIQLSASIDGEPGGTGHQQHLVDVQAAGHPFARVWINHPGEDDPWGGNRPSYWAGNGVMPRVAMHGTCCLVLSDLGEVARLPFTHAYAPYDAFDEVLEGKDWRALRSGNGYVLLKATGPIETIKIGPGAKLEHRCHGLRTGWAVLVGDLDTVSLSAMSQIVARAKLHISDQKLTLQRDGHPNLCLDHTEGLFCDDQPVPFPTPSNVPQVTRHSVPSA